MVECFIGTYLLDKGEGIYRLVFDPSSNKVLETSLFCSAKDSKYLHVENGEVFSLFKGEKQCGVAVYDKHGEIIDSVEYEDAASCYITKIGNYVFTANYHEGTITKLLYHEHSLKIVTQKFIKVKAGCHQIIVLKDSILVPCLFLDKVYICDFDLNITGEFNLPPKAGPRHGVISHDKKYLYLLGELDDALYTFGIQGANFILQDRQSLLAAGHAPSGDSAALRMSHNGKRLFASTRSANQITLIDISTGIPVIKTRISSEGDHPRDILNILDDTYLIVAHKTSGTVVIFKIENDTLNKVAEAPITGAVSIGVMGELL